MIRHVLATRSRPIRRRIRPWQFKERYVDEALKRQSPSIYVEIGVRSGESMRNVHADRKIGIDPVRHADLSLQDGDEFYELPSDDFFAALAPKVLNPASVGAALVDGLHEFRQALRDVLHLEPFMAPGGIIILDDCNPPDADRAADAPTGRAWNGDVWKVAAYLRSERQDLRFVTVDADQGVGLLSGFGTKGPPTPAGELLDKYKDLPYSHLAADRAGVLGLTRPGRSAFSIVEGSSARRAR